MIAGFASFLLLAAPVPPQTAAEPEAPPAPLTLSGEDFLSIQAAARHPEMRRADLACYTIHTGTWRGQRSVTFMGPVRLETKKVPGEPDTVELVVPPGDPHCRDTTFLLNGRREVVKIYHDFEELEELLDGLDEGPADAPRK
jgi:hypothetical protein